MDRLDQIDTLPSEAIYSIVQRRDILNIIDTRHIHPIEVDNPINIQIMDIDLNAKHPYDEFRIITHAIGSLIKEGEYVNVLSILNKANRNNKKVTIVSILEYLNTSIIDGLSLVATCNHASRGRRARRIMSHLYENTSFIVKTNYHKRLNSPNVHRLGKPAPLYNLVDNCTIQNIMNYFNTY